MRKRAELDRLEIPDFEGKPSLTLLGSFFSFSIPRPSQKLTFLLLRALLADITDILSDPLIKHIPWSEITLGRHIGKGASGLVSAGIWKVYVPLPFFSFQSAHLPSFFTVPKGKSR